MLALHVRQLNLTYQRCDGFRIGPPGMAERLARVLKDLADKGKLQDSLDVLESAATTSTKKSDSTPSKFDCMSTEQSELHLSVCIVH